MSYDEAIKQLEDIVASLETDEAVSMNEYKQKAKEANKLIAYCREQLVDMEKELKSALNEK